MTLPYKVSSSFLGFCDTLRAEVFLRPVYDVYRITRTTSPSALITSTSSQEPCFF